jgi:hypothetical protein
MNRDRTISWITTFNSRCRWWLTALENHDLFDNATERIDRITAIPFKYGVVLESEMNFNETVGENSVDVGWFDEVIVTIDAQRRY